MTTRLSIVNQIEEDLKKIKISRGYKHEPVEIKRGLYRWVDFPTKPALCFSLYMDEDDVDSLSGDLARWLKLYFYGFIETDGLGDTTRVQEFEEDVENFLNSTDNTYKLNTLIGNVEIKEGGVNDPINSFIIEASIMYET